MSNEAESSAPEFPRNPDALIQHTNMVRIRTRLYDTVVSFYLEDIDGERRHLADFHMSHVHAKSLAHLLRKQVAEYEANTKSKLPDVEGKERVEGQP